MRRVRGLSMRAARPVTPGQVVSIGYACARRAGESRGTGREAETPVPVFRNFTTVTMMAYCILGRSMRPERAEMHSAAAYRVSSLGQRF